MGIGSIKITNPKDLLVAYANSQIRDNFSGVLLAECPRCGLLVPDTDGHGVQEHLELTARKYCQKTNTPYEVYPKPCGYCSHKMEGEKCVVCDAVRGTGEYLERRSVVEGGD